MSPTLEVLHVPDCPNVARLLARLRELTEIAVVTREVSTEGEARAFGMAGSPTLLVDGVDPFAADGPGSYGLACRLYRDERGEVVPVPSAAQLRSVVARSSRGRETVRPVATLSAWRSRARVLDPGERRMHQAILRSFAATGRAPSRDALGGVAAASGRSTMDLLRALHDLDAVRLTPDGRIAVAYPFSATPTRHRVRIQATGDATADSAPDVEVWAMCAIDALGISAMTGRGAVVESVDPASGRPVTVAMPAPADRSGPVWDPPTAAVVVAVEPGGGPSADCCCDLINVFTDTAGAQAWLAAQPRVRGQVLDPAEALKLGQRLFGPLLSDEP